VDPVPDPLLLRKSVSAGNRTRDLWVSSQELRPLDHRGGLLALSVMFPVPLAERRTVGPVLNNRLEGTRPAVVA
jgi:hypothetical protein